MSLILWDVLVVHLVHCLHRELRVKDGKIFQYPAKELERLQLLKREKDTILDDEKDQLLIKVVK